MFDLLMDVSAFAMMKDVADVPDPMPMDIADVFVILKPSNEWTSA